MNRIKQLIEELCPEGVEFKELGEVAYILNGYAFKSKLYSKDGVRVIRISDVQKGRISGESLIFYPIQTLNEIENYLLYENDLVMSLTGNVGRVAIISNKHLPAGLNQRVACIRVIDNNKVLIRFLFHFFDQNEFERDAMNSSSGAGQKNMSTIWLSNYKIPIPPLPIQQEIVTILDTFTALDASLQAELEARRKQYEHYRNQLLNFEGKEVEWKMLGECLQRTKGTPITAQQMSEINKEGAPIKIFAGGKTVAYVDYGDIPEKDILTKKSIVVKSRGIIEFEYIDKPFSHKNEFWSYHSNNSNIIIKYVFYYLKCKEPYFQSVGQRMSKMPQLSIPDTDKYSIPIPPLSEQERIVGILDQFDSLVNVELPAEIDARRKQYEYYREKLLTFEPLAN